MTSVQFPIRGARPTILVAAHDLDLREYIESALTAQGYSVLQAEDGEEALHLLESAAPVSLLLLDVVMPGKDGIEILREIRRRMGGPPAILLSTASQGSYGMQALGDIQALFLRKPFHHAELVELLRATMQGQEQVACPGPPPLEVWHRSPRSRNPGMKEIERILGLVGLSDVPILLEGETGVGKEVLARQLHALSERAPKPFLKLNCAALPSELVESELFGYQRGAFTGAFKDTPGKFQRAQGGTILLDEIGDMDVRLQAKLLQVLQDSEFQRLGSAETIRVNVRVMSATHRDLRKAVHDGSFREDLFYRLNVFSLRIPPLRDRKEEIPWLAEHFLRKHNLRPDHPPSIGPALRQALLSYDWPGNVRELENMMRKLLVLQREDTLVDELQWLTATQVVELVKKNEKSVLDGVTKKAEMDAALNALHATRWNRKQAAKLLNMEYKTFLYKLKRLGIDGKSVDSVSAEPASASRQTA